MSNNYEEICQYNFCKCLSTSMQKEAKFIIFIKRVCAMFDWHEMRTSLNYQVNTHQTFTGLHKKDVL